MGLLGYDKTLRAVLSEMGTLYFKRGPRDHGAPSTEYRHSEQLKVRKGPSPGIHSAVSLSWISMLSHCEKTFLLFFEEAYHEELCYGSTKILTSPQEKWIQISRSRIFISITCLLELW